MSKRVGDKDLIIFPTAGKESFFAKAPKPNYEETIAQALKTAEELKRKSIQAGASKEATDLYHLYMQLMQKIQSIEVLIANQTKSDDSAHTPVSVGPLL